jgi:hypothetical protein
MNRDEDSESWSTVCFAQSNVQLQEPQAAKGAAGTYTNAEKYPHLTLMAEKFQLRVDVRINLVGNSV